MPNSETQNNIIYLDNSATTPVSGSASDAMIRAAKIVFGNPSSLHNIGLEAEKIVSAARDDILSAIGASGRNPGKIIFCGSGTEANNLAIIGSATAKKRNRGGRIIISDGEHASVDASAEEMQNQGFELVRIPTKSGVLDLGALESALTPNTIAVSLMLVNNETGALYDVSKAFSMTKQLCPSAVTHCDAVQGFLKIPFTVKSLGADLITISAHKIHGAKGTAALYIAPEIIKSKNIRPVIFGGGQEYGLRSGTQNVPGIAAFGAAVREGFSAQTENIARMSETMNYLISILTENKQLSEKIRLNLAPEGRRAPHILNLTLPGIKSEVMLHFLSEMGIYVSSGSACSSNSVKKTVSRALSAFGLENRDADCSIRISLCPENTKSQMDLFASALSQGIEKLAYIK